MNEIISYKEFQEMFKSSFKSYEERDQQQIMWDAIADAFEHEKRIAIEAPTGTGKTFGYSVPAVYQQLVNYLKEKETPKVILSTFTISLQEQLMKDLEVLKDVYDSVMKKAGETKRLKIVNLKGVSNYFCQLRYLQNQSLLGDYPEEEITRLINKNKPKTFQDFGKHFSTKQWNQVKVESCQSHSCPFYSNCDYAQAHKETEEADILVVNHALYFYRLFYSPQKWDGASFVVFDESHKLEKVILEAATIAIDENYPAELVEQGLALVEQLGLDKESLDDWKGTYKEHVSIYQFLTMLNSLKQKKERSFRLDGTSLSKAEMVNCLFQLNRWANQMYLDWIKTFLTDEMREDPDVKDAVSPWYFNIQKIGRMLQLLLVTNSDGQGSQTKPKIELRNDIAIWFSKYEYERAGEECISITVHASPEQIHMLGDLFETGTVFTSGTLSQGGSCKPFASRILHQISETGETIPKHLDADIVLSSPFDLQTQTIVNINTHINPRSLDKSQYEQQLIDEIPKLLSIGTQKSFVLFTSNATMWKVFKELKDEITFMDTYNGQPVEIWIQNKTNYKDVIRSFQNPNVRTVLFGSYTYFEGVDLKRDALTQVILTKLPYSVPSDPIQGILSQEKNFTDWEACIRYEQAYGRLIRTMEDYGAFHVLDKRAVYLARRQFIGMFKEKGIRITGDIEEVKRFFELNRKE
ncbi:ATP-dependent DNA helicase [Bacillus cereus]|uniref:DinG family ATP-dependent helicase YoaA n=1 Tax=Bacillus cereus TaxID=1396 RepID=A0A161T624_BACCE|nr:ATP-dependent DNA helicase [Bacillus cereus]KZD66348.1 DinG family ATP-dependent helicase YoaA [Bacillus cereus]